MQEFATSSINFPEKTNMQRMIQTNGFQSCRTIVIKDKLEQQPDANLSKNFQMERDQRI